MTETNVSIELQKALFTALNKNYQVFELVPKSTKYPYIQIGNIDRETDNTKTSTRHVYNVYVHTWSEGTSSMESKVLNQFVNNKVLNDLKLIDLELGIIRLRSERNLTEQYLTNNIYHGVLNFELTIIQHN